MAKSKVNRNLYDKLLNKLKSDIRRESRPLPKPPPRPVAPPPTTTPKPELNVPQDNNLTSRPIRDNDQPDKFIAHDTPKSTCIEAIAYDKIKHTLWVRFLDGSLYSYTKVPKFKYDQFAKVKSKGGYLNKYIKGFHKYEKVE